MKKIKIHTISKTFGADLITPIIVFLKVRDRYRNPLLLESSDYHSGKNSRSFICFEPLETLTVKTHSQQSNHNAGLPSQNIASEIKVFMSHFENADEQALFGYTAYDAVQYMEDIQLKSNQAGDIPLAIYSLYRNIITINHFTDEVTITCNGLSAAEGQAQMQEIDSLLRNKSVPEFKFHAMDEEFSDCSDAEFLGMVAEGKKHCRRGDVFQIVLSRRFEQKFSGDEFNVYRQLRRINPSPYLFYFDYGNFKLFGSSPEAQLIVAKNKAEIHPIAGTYRRTDNEFDDLKAIERLQNDQKENAEHMMLVDLARNDLSRHCTDVVVDSLREPQIYSHVIHLVSKVVGRLKENSCAYNVMCDSFPAGTLSGAPKYKAMHLIDAYEKSPRGFYGGAVGMIGFNGDLNHAIMIRTFMSKCNTLYYRAGAGIVDSSSEESELHEVFNKIGALRKAIRAANYKHELNTVSL